MRNVRRGLAVLLALVMLLPSILIPGLAAGKYQDVPADSWYSEAVDYVTEKGYMTGVSEDRFAPNTAVTRAMFIAVLAKVANAELDDTAVVFSDVPAGKYYTGAVAWAAENGIVSGVSETKFAPNRQITRQDICTIMARFVKVMDYRLQDGPSKQFTDAKAISRYAKDAVTICSKAGLISGFTDGTFRPKGTATRAQIASIIMRLDKMLAGQIVDPVPMPAQSFDGAAGEGMNVSVNAPEGALPENTNMTVSRVTDEAALAAIKAKTGTEIYAAADITFTKDGAELEPEKAVEVQIALDGLENIEHPTVVHVLDDGSVEYVAAEVVSATRGTDKALRFYSKDFSVYAVTEDPSGGNAFTVTVNFYVRTNKASGPSDIDDNWKLINKQIIRSNQIDAAKDNDDILIFDPGVPELKSTQAFEGWAQTKTFTDSDDKLSVADMNAKMKADYKSGTLKATVEKSFYAEVYDVVYITYHDQKGTVLETQFEHVDSTRKINKKFIKSYSPFKDDQAFFGWIPAAGIKTDENGKLLLGDYPEYTDNAASLYYKLYDANNAAATTYEITYQANANNLDVYPYLQKGYWLIYDTNIDGNNTANDFDDSTSATYTGPKLYRAGEDTVAPTQPTRTGYTFGGWYTDPSMRTEFTFGSPLTATTTIYAKWTPATTKYRVVYWKQKSTDSVNAVDSVPNTNPSNLVAKAYDYAGYREVTGVTTGSNAQIITSDTTKGNKSGTDFGYFFIYNENKTDTGAVSVKGDGTTVLNVYYDRRVITYNFYSTTTLTNVSQVNTFNVNTQYFYSSSYYPVWVQSTNPNYPDADGNIPKSSCQFYYDSGNTTYTLSSNSVTTSSIRVFSGTPTIRQGLYQAQLPSSDMVSAGSGYIWHAMMMSDSTPAELMSVVYSTYIPSKDDRTTINAWIESYSPSGTKHYIYDLGQDTDGNYTIQLREDFVVSGETMYYSGDNYYGYGLVGYSYSSSNANNMTSWNVSSQGQLKLGYSDFTGPAYTFFARNKWDLVYYSNGTIYDTKQVYYGKELKNYNIAAPSTVPTGCFFDGWYADESCTTPFDFTKAMPNADVVVYAKWTPLRFRAILDFTGGDPDVNPADIHFPGNQATAFRLDYLEQIQSSSIQACSRDGYVLMGWYYYDKDGEEHEYDFSMGANEDMADMTYGTQGDGETDEAYAARMNGSTREGSDPFNAANPTWDDKWTAANPKRKDVRGKITIFAKWRVDPDAVADAKVTYHGDHDKIDTGYFETNGQPHIWIDPKSYGDMSQAYAQAASVPETAGEQFLYWEVLRPVKDENGEYVKDANGEIVFEPTGEKAYPGQTFEVDLDDAVKTRTYIGGVDPNHEHQLEAVAATTATCTEAAVSAHYRCTICGKLFTDETGETETTLDALTTQGALGHDWPTEWQSNEGGHYKYCQREGCSSGNNGGPANTGGAHEWVVDSETPAEIGVAGSRDEHCSVCGYSHTVTIPALTGYTVTYHVPTGLTAPAAQTEVAGTEITLPTMGNSGDYTFLGWVTAEIPTATDTQPTILTGAYTVNANADLYAVYSYTEASGASGEYELVTSAPADWTGNYVITYLNTTSMYVMKGVTPSSNGAAIESSANASSYSAAGVSLSGTTLSNVSNNYVFTLAKHGSYYSIQNVATGTYLGMDSGCGAVCGYTTYTSGDCDWTPGPLANATSALNSYNNTADGSYPYLSYSTNSSNLYFWAGSSGGTATTSIYWWKETTTTTTYYTTAFDTTPGGTDYTVSFSVPEGVTAIADMTVNSATGAALPTAGAPEGYTFLGWVTDTVDNVAAEPANILTGTYRPTANITLKALYSYTGTIPGGYKLSDSAPAAGETVILAGKNGDTYYALNHTVTGTNGTELSFTNGVVADTTNILWDVTSGTYGIYLRKNGDSGNQRLKLNSSALGYTILADQNGSSNTGAMSFTASGDGFDMYGTHNTGRHLGFSGTTFSVSSAANTIYVFKYVAGVTNGTVYTTEIGGSSAATFTVTYMANGSQMDQVSVVEGESINLPTTATAVTGWTFVGWVEADTTETTEPTFLAKGASVTPTGDKTYYALYSQTSGGNGTSWEKASAVAVGDTVAIVCEGVSKELTGFNTNYSGIGSDYSGNPSCSYELNVVQGSTSSTIAFKDSNNNYITNNTNNATASLELTTSLTAASSWTVTFSGGNAAIKNASATTRQILWRAGNFNYFRVFASSNATVSGYYQVQLYKKNTSSGGTTTWTTTPGNGGNAVTEPEVEVVREEKLNEALLTENADRSLTAAAGETAGMASVTPAPVVTASTTVASWNCDTVDNVSDWVIIDADGDGYNWVVYTSATSYTHDASDACLLSYSYYSSTALTPDNWAVSPAINVPANGTTTLTFWARGSNSSYYAEKFEVRALTAAPTSSNYTSGTVVMSETTTTASWTQYTVDLSSYKGQTIYLEFRHFDTTDMLALGLDDIIITNVVLPKLTINYQYENGTQAAETYVQEYAEGTEYRVVSPTIPGYTCDKPIVSDTMGASDVTVTVTYTAVEVEEEEWEPTTVIKPGEDYLIAYMINGTPYLLVNYNVSATNHYYYSYTGTSSTSTLGYLAPAVVDSQTGYITGVSGAATNLNYCKWLFETDAGGKITSSYESGRMLYWNNNGVYPNTTGDSWVWTVTNEANNLGTMHSVYNSANYYFTTRSSTGSTSYSSGTPYAGIYSTAPASGNIRLYKRHVDEDTTWTVKFVNYNYTSLATEGYPDQTITNNGVVTKPAADPTRNEDYEFAGWYIIGQDEPYDFSTPVTKDLTLQARYTMVYTYTYNLHLRAVYGMRNTTGKTHIYWYANDGTTYTYEKDGETINCGEGAGARFEQNEVDMNMPYSIPYPTTSVTPSQKLTWTSGTWQPGQTQNAPTGLVYVGHTFLGWARVNTTGAGTTGTAHPELTEDDLYLKWDAENNRYLYRQESRDGTVSWTNATAVTDVYADESQPYHDMYAVWSSHVFYVYHSSSGILQAFELPTSTAASGSMIGTFDITKLVPDGYLYGGYYSTYGGVNMDAVEAARGASTGWSTGTLVSTNWSEIAELNTADIAAVDFHAYDGSSLTNGTKKFWTKADAYNVDNLPIGMTAADVNGETMKPEADTIYYLKEVPDTYLHSYYAYVLSVKTAGSEPNPDTESDQIESVDAVYLLTVVDDNNYKTTGMRTGTGYSGAEAATLTARTSIANKFTLVQKESATTPANSHTYTASDLSNEELTRGYISVNRLADVTARTFTMLPTWKTLDGVTVGSTAPLDVTIGKKNVTDSETEIAEEKEYVYVELNDWWLGSDATIKVQTFGAENEVFETVTRIEGTKIFRFEKRDGQNGFRVFRYSSDGNTYWNKSVYVAFNTTSNFATGFYYVGQDNYHYDEDNYGVTWKTYIP